MRLYGKVNSIINHILSESYISRFYNEEYKVYENKKITEHIVLIIKRLKSVYKNTKQIESLISYLLINIDLPSRKIISSEFDVPDRLSYVKEKTESYNNAARYPYAWSFWIEKFSSEKELLKFLDHALIYDELKEHPEILISFYSALPKEASKRKILFEAFSNIKNSTNLKYKENAIRYFSENRISTQLVNESSGFKEPMFKVEKSFYEENLKKEKAILYSIFKLSSLGLFEDDFLLFIYASRI